jgi:hypothetical protein
MLPLLQVGAALFLSSVDSLVLHTRTVLQIQLLLLIDLLLPLMLLDACHLSVEKAQLCTPNTAPCLLQQRPLPCMLALLHPPHFQAGYRHK